MRPLASQAAKPDPIAMATENTARNAGTTSSAPPSAFLTSGAKSVVTTAPTSQNQLTTRPPHHSRGSRWRSRTST